MIRVNDAPSGLAWVDTNGQYVYAKHLQKLEQALLDVESGKIKRLAIFMPPRHGKSELTSKYFPAWYLGRNPDCRIILSSYEADFAAEWGSKVRNLLHEYGDLFLTPIIIDKASSARNRWDIYGHKGGMQTAGVGGPITGKGAKILIIDDPVKNAEQANSVTYREKAKDWYKSTAFTRLEPDGAVILIQTRWHEDDLGGWLLSEFEDDWTIINFPAINDNGEALWPDRYNINRLNEIKRTVGEYWFNAMYQQTPQPAEGGILKRSWIQYYDPKTNYEFNNSILTVYTGWDLAISQKETADYTCSCTAKYNPKSGNLFIVDWTQEHLTFPEQQQEVLKIQRRYNAAMIGIEVNAYQEALPQSLKQHMLPITGVRRISDKVTRIQSAFTAFEQGNVFVPEGHPLQFIFENEFVTFPTGVHDDLLDATEMVISLARKGANPYSQTDNYYDFSKRQLETGRRRPKRMY
jgi:predicted phage terminase large subunit-like protein